MQKLVPDFTTTKLRTMKVGEIARLAVKCKAIPSTLVRLKEIFPLANVSRMVANKPDLLYENTEAIARRAEELKTRLGTEDIDRAVELNPTFLDLKQVDLAIDEIKRLMPKENPQVYLVSGNKMPS